MAFKFYIDGQEFYAMTRCNIIAADATTATDHAITNAAKYFYETEKKFFDPGKHTSVLVTRNENILPICPYLT